jgi:Restriction Endonuclease associating with ARP
MAVLSGWYTSQLRQELILRNRLHAHRRAHVESYGNPPVIVYAPEGCAHGNFFGPAYAAITACPQWMRRFDKIHAQAARTLPKAERKWRELDSCMSSDALLMNIFCTPGVAQSTILRNALGLDRDADRNAEPNAELIFGWKARVPLRNGRFDRTEVDLRFGSLLIEAKLTESDFQTRIAPIVEAYRDFDLVFDRDLLPRIEIAAARPKRNSEFPENYSQEFESVTADPASFSVIDVVVRPPGQAGYASYQLIRNVLAAHTAQCSFCVLHDARRPDLREQWFRVIAAVKSADLRARLKVLTWQELAAYLPGDLQQFLDSKYGIAAPGNIPSSLQQEPA